MRISSGEKTKRGRKGLLALGLALVLGAGMGSVATAGEELSALDAFEMLRSGDRRQEEEQERRALLERVMAGDFERVPEETKEQEELAGKLSALCEVTDADLASYAAARSLAMAQVRHAYFLALANALRAEISLNPNQEEKLRNIQTILSLFLQKEDEEGTGTQREQIRSRMSRQESVQLAKDSHLPQDFLEYLIMDEDWEDEDWGDDLAWQETADQAFFGDDDDRVIVIGDRDSSDSEEIARMQELLISLGYLNGKADGVFGPRTQAALLEFQLANGLRPTGTCTAAERYALGKRGAVARWDYVESFYDPDAATGMAAPAVSGNGGGALAYATPDYATPDYATPAYATPDYATPDHATPDYATPDHATPDYETPDYETPDYETPDYDTPDYETPDDDADDG